jgi:phosphomannomutase
MSPDELVRTARSWRDEDPDAGDRAEVDALLAAVEAGPGPAASEALDGLRERFGAGLSFGTAGLRGAMGAGPNRMNRAVAIRATAGLAAHLRATGHAGEPVIVGFDARHRSARMAADAAAVLAGAGFTVHLGERPLPTPVVAFGILHLGCAAGVVVTASHNPPQDNGYKVYLDDGAQIVPPSDAEIAARIAAVGPLAGVPLAPADDPRIGRVGDDLVEAYLTGAVATAVRSGPAVGPAVGSAVRQARAGLRVVYTPMHGVGRDVLVAAFERAGFAAPAVVPEQAEPDPEFPTVAFPNPEEPGALDLALALADRMEADLLLANDPDADRLLVAVPSADRAGGWRVLTGDEIGALLADWLLAGGTGADRLVVNSIVSSSLLARLAEARGVQSASVLTGFKWIARAASDRPDLRFVYGFEEAIGSSVGTLVRDKDGITAALAVADLAAHEQVAGRTLLDRLDDLARELGAYVTRQRSVRIEGLDGQARMREVVDALAAAPPATLAGRPVTDVEDLRLGKVLPPTDGVRLHGDGIRLIVRPSGTEPKLKFYAEAVVPVPPGGDLAAARAQADALATAILDDAAAITG